MSLQQQIDDQEEVQTYLEKKNVHEILHDMVEQLLINQPTDPVSFMLAHLKKPESKKLFLLGPPGLHLYTIVQKAINDKTNVSFSCFNTGEYFNKNKDSLTTEAKQKLSVCRIVNDEKQIKKILSEISSFSQKQNHCLIQGFPKSLKQALALSKSKTYPDQVIFVNASKRLLHHLCTNKIKQNNSKLSEDQCDKLAQSAATEYLMNIKDLKQYYPTYLEVNAGNSVDQSDIYIQIQRTLNMKFGSLQPRKNTRIVILGAPYSGRTTLGKKLAQKYELVYVSTAFLISQEIRKGTVTGRKLKQPFLKNELLDNFQVQKLIEDRISKKDCQMQGYILEGYPKNQQQWKNMQSLHICPNFIIGLNPPEQFLRNRSEKAKQFNSRYERWKQFYDLNLKKQQIIYWLESDSSIQNSFEDVCFEIQNHKL